MRLSSPHHPFARRISTRLVATLGIVLAASWGPLSHAFRLIEVSEIGVSGKPGAERSVRIVLARGCILETAPRKKLASQNGSKPASETDKSTTERLLNAAPETLELAQAIHFDLSGVPVAARVSAWLGLAEIYTPLYNGRLLETSDVVANSARGPPTTA
jgi:hypothetical protein